MKKLIPCLALAALLLTSVSAMSQSGGFTGEGAAPAGGGFTGPSTSPMEVVDALSLLDDMPVYLEGNITKSLGGEEYQFTDGTGTITLEIDNDDWQGVTVNPKDKIGVWGEIDKGWRGPVKVDVDRIVRE